MKLEMNSDRADILNQIIARKQVEVGSRAQALPRVELERRAGLGDAPRGFVAA